MRIAMYTTVVILFIATIILGGAVYLQETTRRVNAAQATTAYTVQEISDDTHHNEPLCENFTALVENTDKTFETNVTFAIDQNKHKFEMTSYSSTSSYNPHDMTMKEKVVYLLRCHKSKTI